MNSHLAIKINGRYIALLPDTSIDIEDSNPYFNDVEETWSYSFSVPIDGNRETFGNVDTIESDKRLADIEDLPMSVEVDGISYRNGRVRASEDQEVRDNIDISMSSSVKSLAEYFQDKNCRDIPVKDYIKIGETIGNIRVKYNCKLSLVFEGTVFTAGAQGGGGKEVFATTTVEQESGQTISFPALGFSRPQQCKVVPSGSSHGYASTGSLGKDPDIIKSFINVSDPYPAPYCNARVCYMHHKKKSDTESSDEIDVERKKEDGKRYNPYFVLDADRPASGICFYILYFLDCLFDLIKKDGIVYDKSALEKVEDMKRLAFYTTRCRFDVENKYLYDYEDSVSESDRQDAAITEVPVWDKKAKADKPEMINEWLHSRNINTTLSLKLNEKKDQVTESVTVDGKEYKKNDVVYLSNGRGIVINKIYYEVSDLKYQYVKADIFNMLANSDNFPDTDVMSVIESLWSAFGIRFYLDQENRTVRPVFIRDIFRTAQTTLALNGEVSEAVRINEKITGVRMRYGAESDRKEQENNVRHGVTDYDTSFDYIDIKPDRLVTSLTYGQILSQAHDANMNLYVDKATGNKYRIKIDADAEERKEYHPVVFEVGQYKGVEIGDCSEDNEDYIEEISIGLDPVIFNDVNGRNEKDAYNSEGDVVMTRSDDETTSVVRLQSTSDSQQLLAGFVSEDMWHEDIPREIAYPIGTAHVDISLNATIKTKEAFDPSSSDTGDSPLQSYDWGTSVTVMRGGGSKANIEYYDYNYDGFGNSKWRTVAGQYTMSSDSIDAWGSVYDYQPGDGIGSEDGRFSLKIRAYINDPVTGEPLCDSRVANRGLFDTFMSEYAHFLLNRKVVRLKYHGNITDLVNIKWDRRYTIGGYTGWINKISTHITAANGIEECTIEMYIL